MSRLRFTILPAAIAIASAGLAPQPAAPAEDIVVTGRGAAQRRQEAIDFVRQISSTPVEGQFARWHDPVCPAVSGLSASLAERVASRIRANARAVRAPVAATPCKANAFIVFTSDAAGLLAIMERRKPRLLGGLPPDERQALRRGGAPILWWTGSRAEGADGNQLQSMPSAAFGVIGTSGPAIPASDKARFGDSYRASMISTSLRAAITSAVVLVDVPRSTGVQLDAVADYASFVILARVRPATPRGAAPTILTLFSGESADRPQGLTTADRSYLTGLYTTAPDRPATRQARMIAGSVARGGKAN